MRRRAVRLLLLATALPAQLARAEEPAPSRLRVELAGGATLPGLVSPLGAGLSLGVAASVATGSWLRLGLSVDLGQRPADGALAEPGLPGGALDWTVLVRQVDLTAEALLEWPAGRRARLFVAGGPALVLVESRGGGAAAGEPIAEVVERSAEPGAAVRAGTAWPLADGALLIELRASWFRLDHAATGNASGAALALRVGWQF